MSRLRLRRARAIGSGMSYRIADRPQVQVTDFVISNFTVGETKITATNAASVGMIDVDPGYASGTKYP